MPASLLCGLFHILMTRYVQCADARNNKAPAVRGISLRSETLLLGLPNKIHAVFEEITHCFKGRHPENYHWDKDACTKNDVICNPLVVQERLKPGRSHYRRNDNKQPHWKCEPIRYLSAASTTDISPVRNFTAAMWAGNQIFVRHNQVIH